MCWLPLLSLTIRKYIHPAERGSEVHAMATNNLPVTAKLIAKKTTKDTVLARLATCIHHGSWPSPVPDDLIAYHWQRLELSVQDRCVIWRKHVIIPKVLRTKLLEELHVRHIWICHMKAFVRSHLWWLHLDQGIEAMAVQCKAYKITMAVLSLAAHYPW